MAFCMNERIHVLIIFSCIACDFNYPCKCSLGICTRAVHFSRTFLTPHQTCPSHARHARGHSCRRARRCMVACRHPTRSLRAASLPSSPSPLGPEARFGKVSWRGRMSPPYCRAKARDTTRRFASPVADPSNASAGFDQGCQAGRACCTAVGASAFARRDAACASKSSPQAACRR